MSKVPAQTGPGSAFRAVLPAYAASRVLLLVAAWAFVAHSPAAPGTWSPLHNWPMLDGWARLDAGWYAAIVREGYQFIPGKACNVNFFPGFPWFIGALSWPFFDRFGVDAAFALAGHLLSLGLFWVALAGVWRLAEQAAGPVAATRTAWLVAFFPFSLFFSAVYSESLFLSLVIWSFVFARQRSWAWACALAALAAVTRTIGCLVAVGLFVSYLRDNYRRDPQAGWRGMVDRDLGWFFLTPAPLLALMGYFQTNFGHPLPFLITYTTVWDKRPGLRRLVDVLNSVRHADVPTALRVQNAAYIAVVAAFLAALWAWRRRMTAGEWTWALASVLLVALTGFDGAGRYMAVVFPVFVAAGQALSGRQTGLLVALMLPWLLWFTWCYTQSLYIV